MKQIKLMMAALAVPLCLTACQGLEDLFVDEGAAAAPIPYSSPQNSTYSASLDPTYAAQQNPTLQNRPYVAPKQKTSRFFFPWQKAARPENNKPYEEKTQQNVPPSKASRTEQAAEIPVEIVPVARKTKEPRVPTLAPSATGYAQ